MAVAVHGALPTSMAADIDTMLALARSTATSPVGSRRPSASAARTQTLVRPRVPGIKVDIVPMDFAMAAVGLLSPDRYAAQQLGAVQGRCLSLSDLLPHLTGRSFFQTRFTGIALAHFAEQVRIFVERWTVYQGPTIVTSSARMVSSG